MRPKHTLDAIRSEMLRAIQTGNEAVQDAISVIMEAFDRDMNDAIKISEPQKNEHHAAA